MTLRSYITKHRISLPQLSDISGVPYPTIKKNIDTTFMPKQQAMIREGLRNYHTAADADVDLIDF